MRIAGFEYESVVDGPGVRFTIFTQGCKHRCPGCHNPSTWDFSSGTEMSIDELVEEVKKNTKISKRVTLSGGDPMYQWEEAYKLTKLLKASGYKVGMYTGFTADELLSMKDPRIIEFLSELEFVVDGPFIKKLKTLELPFVGSSNQRILKFTNTGDFETIRR